MKKILIITIITSLLFVVLGNAQTGANFRIIETPPGFYSEDVGVAAFTDADHAGIDKTGASNSRVGIQNLLNQLRDAGGGTLYLSTGRYRIEGASLIIPKGVVLRGDWKKPQKDESITGTILMAYHGRGFENEEQAFIIMEPASGLYNVAIWHPDQTPANIVPYPPSILFGRQGVWGNDYCNARNITLVNSYSGIVLSRLNGGGCPNMFNIYGSPLSRGIEIDNIADVGRFDWICFSPDYWAASGLPGAPAKDGAHKQYIRENATGIVMRRNDWSYTCHVSIEGYNTGFYAGVSMVEGRPNGHNYHLTFIDCVEAIRLNAVSNAGIMFTRVRIIDCDYGIVVGPNISSAAQILDFEITARNDAIFIDADASLKFMTHQGVIHSGEVKINAGVFYAVDNDFNNDAPQVFLGTRGRTVLTGNRFLEPVEINNQSLFRSAIEHEPVLTKRVPEFPEIRPRQTMPARNALYVVTDAEFGAVANAIYDNTDAIQNALDKAASEGGGIVFLPPGKYRVDGNLVVPTGVEIKGASDLASVPKGQGSIIEIYAGKNDPDGEPFLKLSERSGIRGITFNYPEQRSSMTLVPGELPQYPYCMRATGADVYIVNVGVRATYRALDLFTHKCDNHYVDYLAGHVFKNAIRIGGGTTNGLISNIQFNTIVMSNGFEYPKFGGWTNSENEPAIREAVYNQNWRELLFMILEDCVDQILYNNFHFASFQGLIFGNNGTYPSGISMGTGVDASMRPICFEGICPQKGFDLINSQIVSVAREVFGETRFLETSPDFTCEAWLFSSDYWGSARFGGVFGGGTINLVMPHFATHGTERFLEITGDANVNINNGYANATNFVAADHTGQVSVESSVVGIASPSGYRLWYNNITTSPALQPQLTLARTGWIATASHNNNNAFLAIDGNVSTRWTAGSQENSGQWFAVNTRQPVTFNTIVLDQSGSPNDWPAQYAVHISNNGINWGTPILTGTQPASIVIIEIPVTTTQYVMIVQTGGGRSNFWSMHEFYLALRTDGDNQNGNQPTWLPEEDLNIEETAFPYINHKILYFTDFEQISANATVSVFNITGQRVMTTGFNASGISLEHLNAGMYIVMLQEGNEIRTWKVIIGI